MATKQRSEGSAVEALDAQYIRNCWYVAAWDHEITHGQLLGRTLLDNAFVFYRQSSGAVTAFDDRCSHRLAPLSLGRLEGDHLRCMYHGAVYDPTGACIEIPGQTRIPPQLRVRSYPVVERDHYVWIWPGDPALADPASIPDCHWLDDPGWVGKPGETIFAANYLLLVDNLLDFSHLTYVHAATFGGSDEIAKAGQTVEEFPWGVRVTRRYPNIEMPTFARPIARFSDPVDRWHIYDWYIGGNVLSMDSGWAPAGTGALEGRLVPEAMQFRLVQALTPETASKTHYFWSQPRNFELQDDALTETLYASANAGFAEDRAMIEAQQDVINKHPDALMRGIALDAGLNRVRKLINNQLLRESREALERDASPSHVKKSR
jgi:phenylpropionate dioxygenase-like ring-hydroxylating dioxygenase large terminal subunit